MRNLEYLITLIEKKSNPKILSYYFIMLAERISKGYNLNKDISFIVQHALTTTSLSFSDGH